MSRKSRVKGASFERETAARWAAVLGRSVKRRLGQARDSGHDLDGTEPYVIECKRRARIAVYEWMNQAHAAAAGAGPLLDAPIPVVVMRQDDDRSLVLMYETDFLQLLAQKREAP